MAYHGRIGTIEELQQELEELFERCSYRLEIYCIEMQGERLIVSYGIWVSCG